MGLGGRSPRATSGARTVTVLLAVVAAACTTPPADPVTGPVTPRPGPTPTAAPPPVLRVATAPPESLDPRELQSTEQLTIASQLFDGLVAYHPETLALVPAAASQWTVGDDGRRFVFRLHPDARFHDGSPLRARDFIFAWNRLADPSVPAPFSFLLEEVEGYDRYREDPDVTSLPGLSAPNDQTLQVRLSEPWPGFVSTLGHPALSPVPPAARRRGFALEPVGNGPYRLTGEAAPTEPIVLRRFGRYHGAEPAVARVEFRPFEDPEEAWPAFLGEEIDVAPIPTSAVPEAVSRFGSEGIVTLARFLYCGMNQLEPRLASAQLGRAISLAVDRRAIAAQVYAGLAVPATGIVPPTIPGWSEDVCGNRCRRNLERAVELVEGLSPQSRRFSLDYPRSPVGDALAEQLTGQLEEAGFRVQPQPHPENRYRRLLERGNQEMFCLSWGADYPRQQALLEPLLRSGSPDNVARVADEELDRTLERARTNPSPTTRQELYEDAERRALSRMPLVPLVWFRSRLAVQPDVEGFVLDPLGLFDVSAIRVEGQEG